jgi:hypothetical protein
MKHTVSVRQYTQRCNTRYTVTTYRQTQMKAHFTKVIVIVSVCYMLYLPQKTTNDVFSNRDNFSNAAGSLALLNVAELPNTNVGTMSTPASIALFTNPSLPSTNAYSLLSSASQKISPIPPAVRNS